MKLRHVILSGLLGFALAGFVAPRVKAEPADDAEVAKSLASAHAAANGDPLLEALLTELERSKAQLKMDQVAAPYYIEYRVSDVEEFITEAAFGALRENQKVHVRLMRVVVRIGDYKQDSYYSEGMGQTTILPLDNDPIALRHQIWLATDEAYKEAGQALTQKQSTLKQFTADEHPVDDFAKAPVVALVQPIASLRVDEAGWKKSLEDATNLYRTYPDIQSLSAFARFSLLNEYFVNSEGTVTRTGRNTYSVQLSASTQAPDGMRLARSPAWTVAKYEELPTREKLLQYSREALDTLKALRDAPIVDEEYRGPVLFEADAADDVIAGLIGGNVLGRKPQLGAPNRTTGGFATSYKSRVLPTFIDVIDDPTMKEFQGKSVVGGYEVDSEGVRSQAVDVIDKGVLTNYLLGRQPIRDFPSSNGHGRAAPATPPGPNLGVLLLKSSEAKSLDDLKKAMTERASTQGQAFGYRVVTMGGSAPRLLYRVYAKDGHEELVRGAVFSELDIRALRSDLSAAGNDPLVSNRLGGVATTVISPSLLFDELQVKRADTSKDKLPDYPAPPLVKK
ncbi:MAG TPA: metallopeptidase TldD-related protein [Candidatus Dormibacteraeota bacterium]|nr:metallopeptidase TldD-related protein [Candidatus Dormibacteraeota bacterium]